MASEPDDPNADPAAPPSASGPLSTRGLVRRSQDHEPDALGRLSEKVLSFLHTRFCNAVLPPETEFDDFASDVMVRLLGGIGRFQDRGPGSFWGWLHALASHRLDDAWRRHQRDRKSGNLGVGLGGADGAPEGATLPEDHCDDGAESASQIVRRQELERAEADCTARLPRELRSVYLYRRRDELPFAEIAERMPGIKEVTLRSHFKRGRDYVRECLGKKLDLLGDRVGGWRSAAD
jgi:RNA polymerase sigma factor (sigma-70 family)